jgi:hypothetical protein
LPAGKTARRGRGNPERRRRTIGDRILTNLHLSQFTPPYFT